MLPHRRVNNNNQDSGTSTSPPRGPKSSDKHYPQKRTSDSTTPPLPSPNMDQPPRGYTASPTNLQPGEFIFTVQMYRTHSCGHVVWSHTFNLKVMRANAPPPTSNQYYNYPCAECDHFARNWAATELDPRDVRQVGGYRAMDPMAAPEPLNGHAFNVNAPEYLPLKKPNEANVAQNMPQYQPHDWSTMAPATGHAFTPQWQAMEHAPQMSQPNYAQPSVQPMAQSPSNSAAESTPKARMRSPHKVSTPPPPSDFAQTSPEFVVANWPQEADAQDAEPNRPKKCEVAVPDGAAERSLAYPGEDKSSIKASCRDEDHDFEEGCEICGCYCYCQYLPDGGIGIPP